MILFGKILTTAGLNPLSKHFATICVSDLVLVNEDGEVVIGDEPINAAAFAIHSEVCTYHHLKYI